MATGGTATLDTTGEYLFQVTDRPDMCTSFVVAADSGNGANVKVLVTGLHTSGEEIELGPGEVQVFRYYDNQLAEVHAKAASGSQTVRYGIVAKTGGGY